MLDKLGKRKFILPIMAVVVIFCILSLLVYPILNATPKNVPFAIVNLDKGIETPMGSMNLGDKAVDTMTEGLELEEGAESPIAWTKLSDEAALDEAMENNEFYGAIIFPEDFSVKQAATRMAAADAGAVEGVSSETAPSAAALAHMAAAAGATEGTDPTAKPDVAAAAAIAAQAGVGETTAQDTEAPVIKIIINQGKNPMLATTMQTALGGMIEQTGLSTEITTINSIEAKTSGAANMMSGMVMVMPLFLVSLISSILLFLIFRPSKGSDKVTRIKACIKQLVYAAFLSLLVSCAAVLIIAWLGGMDVAVGTLILFLWLASFCLMTLFIGSFNIALPLGVLVAITCLACGMSSGMLAPEMLPEFWQNWIYPWVPQHFIADGVNAVIYMGKGAWNTASMPLVITACVGLGAMLISLFVPSKPEPKKAA